MSVQVMQAHSVHAELSSSVEESFQSAERIQFTFSQKVAPTTPTVRSEFFKPCQDSQELAFCLNEGECFIIETVAGVHRHCR
ncbi:pro-neuregulin-3, membrane-bound isoform isoform X1 [Tachysurus ichikawai]